MALDDEGPRPQLVTWYVDDLVIDLDVANAHPWVLARLLSELRGGVRPGGHAVTAPVGLPDVVGLAADEGDARSRWPAGLPQGAAVSPFAAWLGAPTPPLPAAAGAWRGIDGASGRLGGGRVGELGAAADLVEVD